MKRNLIIQSSLTGLDIALLEDDKLVEFHQDVANQEYMVGDIYLGRVKKILPGLNACFIDIGHEKNAFLHYHDLGPDILNFNEFTQKAINSKSVGEDISEFKRHPEIDKNGSIQDVLKADEPIVVQIVKEPISTKGHRLTSQITLTGRFFVLIPFSNGLSVSKRIHEPHEKKRLQNVFQKIKPENFGLIIRTAAENQELRLLERDFYHVYGKWQEIVRNLSQNKLKLLGEENKAMSILREMLNDTFDSIIVDNKQTYNQLYQYLEKISPDSKNILKLNSDIVPLFEQYKIDRQIKSLFGKIVNFGKGSYLVIEHTEAMTVIDINSGTKTAKETDREENVLHVNMEAAEEIARQLRLRDIGGLIIVDFIDMRSAENQRLLLEHMKNQMKKDKTKHVCLPLSKFGLMEITRERVRPVVDLASHETCPVCRGTGQVKPTTLIIDDIEHSLNFICSELKIRYIVLKVHPFIASYLKRGLLSKRLQWVMKYKSWISVITSANMHLLDYKFLDRKGRDILEEY
ncbi:MAG: Rne/Rng family ribonuclease [Sphingobacteriales bacterium]|nr:Rne/Rng family ribonuclease [Sphingobacteriales bacterium]